MAQQENINETIMEGMDEFADLFEEATEEKASSKAKVPSRPASKFKIDAFNQREVVVLSSKGEEVKIKASHNSEGQFVLKKDEDGNIVYDGKGRPKFEWFLVNKDNKIGNDILFGEKEISQWIYCKGVNGGYTAKTGTAQKCVSLMVKVMPTLLSYEANAKFEKGIKAVYAEPKDYGKTFVTTLNKLKDGRNNATYGIGYEKTVIKELGFAKQVNFDGTLESIFTEDVLKEIEEYRASIDCIHCFDLHLLRRKSKKTGKDVYLLYFTEYKKYLLVPIITE